MPVCSADAALHTPSTAATSASAAAATTFGHPSASGALGSSLDLQFEGCSSGSCLGAGTSHCPYMPCAAHMLVIRQFYGQKGVVCCAPLHWLLAMCSMAACLQQACSAPAHCAAPQLCTSCLCSPARGPAGSIAQLEGYPAPVQPMYRISC